MASWNSFGCVDLENTSISMVHIAGSLPTRWEGEFGVLKVGCRGGMIFPTLTQRGIPILEGRGTQTPSHFGTGILANFNVDLNGAGTFRKMQPEIICFRTINVRRCAF